MRFSTRISASSDTGFDIAGGTGKTGEITYETAVDCVTTAVDGALTTRGGTFLVHLTCCAANSLFANQICVQNAGISDTRSTGVYMHTRDSKCLLNLQPCTVQDQIKVTVANRNFVTSTHIGDLILTSDQNIISYILTKTLFHIYFLVLIVHFY